MAIETLVSLALAAGHTLPPPIAAKAPAPAPGVYGSGISISLPDWLRGIGGELSPEDAMRVSAVYACVSLKAGAVASLSLPIYERSSNGRESVNHDYWWLLNERPHPNWSAAAFWEYLVQSVDLQGDAFALVQRNKAGKAIAFQPLDPRKVTIVDLPEGRVYVYQDRDTRIGAWADDILHIPGQGFDGVRGMSPLKFAAKSAVNLSQAATGYSESFFANNARPDILLVTPGALSPEQTKDLADQWASRYSGPGNHHKPAVLQGGLTAQPLTINADDAQLIATRQFQVEDICRVFGVPPFMVGHTEKTTSWGSGVDSMGINFVKFTLRKFLAKAEQELNTKLFRVERYFTEFKVAALERGDIKTRYDAYGRALGGSSGSGFMTQNEVRKLENLPPLDGADTLSLWSQNASSAGGNSQQSQP